MQLVYFEKQYQSAVQEEKAAAKKADQLSIARLVSFTFIVFAAAMGYDLRNPLWYLLTGCGALSFLFFLRQHRATLLLQTFLQSRQTVLRQYITRFSTDWHTFHDNGETFISEEHPHAKDLDLLGKNSLYQYLCAANTPDGKKKLAELLLHGCSDAAEIGKRQAAVKELVDKLDFTLELQAHSNLLIQAASHKASDESTRWLDSLTVSPRPAARVVSAFRLCLPILTLSAILLAITGYTPFPAIVLPFIQLAFSGFFYGRNTASLRPLFLLHEKLRHYAQIFCFLESVSFSSSYLNELQKILRSGGGISLKMRRLHTISECVNMRYNFIFYLIGSSLLLWDFQCAHAFARWRRAHGVEVSEWLATLGEIEALLSLAVLGQVKSVYSFPTILPNDAPEFHAESFYHPLIEERASVANSFTLSAQTCIITGSNMSGKTTFLRSIGVSTVLAYAGAPVCAERLTLSRMRLFTSLRIEDDISQGISTFYAELLRIRSMVTYAATQRPMLILIDEIFRGTNSADRIVGAAATIAKLTGPWCIALVSTHDFELCDLSVSSSGTICNYHFSEFYTNDEIRFDYCIKPGRCRSTNAKYLMHMVGIL